MEDVEIRSKREVGGRLFLIASYKEMELKREYLNQDEEKATKHFKKYLKDIQWI